MTSTLRQHRPQTSRRSSSGSSRPGRAATSPSSRRRSRSSPSSSATPPTCTPAGASSTSPPAAATRRSRRPGSAARPSASTTCRRCSSKGRLRAAAEGLEVELVEGDAEALPFPDASFDAVTSVFGSMFAPDHEKAAAELLRVMPSGRHDRPRELDADGLHRRPLPHDRRARAAAGGCGLADALGDGGPPPRALRRRDRLARGHGADLHVAVPGCRGLRRVLPRRGTARP